MIPKCVTLENFLSFGNKTVIEFTDDEPIWVLGGANGSGKSAVFDAMTFALFGVHRGGATSSESLVRHGSNGFSVSFEFEFNKVDYRVSRNRIGSRSTASVEQMNPDTGAWKRVENVNSLTEIKGWTERTLGIGFEAFRASVLLRQGDADAIINAKGTERLNILKKIIGVDRYEELSDRVHEGAKSWKDKYSDLSTEQDLRAQEGRGKITPEQLAETAEAVTLAEAARAAAQNDVIQANKRVEHSKQWADLSAKDAKLNDQIRAAEERASKADRIRNDRKTLDDLTVAVPILKKLVAIRDRIVAAELSRTETSAQVESLKKEIERLGDSLAKSKADAETHRSASEHHEHQAKELRKEAAHDQKFIAAAEEVAGLRKQLAAFEKNLDDQLVAARRRYSEASDSAIDAGKVKAEASALLRQAKDRHKEFTKVDIGVKCARCGQKVTAKHAEQEREAIAAEIDALNKRLKKAEASEKEAIAGTSAAETERDRFEKLSNDRNLKAQQLDDKLKTLADFGITANAGVLRNMLAEKNDKATEYESTAREESRKYDAANRDATRFESNRKTMVADREKAEISLRECERKLDADNAQRHTLLDQLAPEWHARVKSIDADETEQLETRRLHLAGAGVEEQFQQLQQDDARRDEWVKQRADVNEQMAAVPAEGRVTLAVAEANEQAARASSKTADAAWTKARDTEITLLQQRDAHNKLVDELAKAERQYDLHHKLDELLGKHGIQRELVRSAEEEIVRLANDTVQNLSAGDLSLELDRSDDTDDQAFLLRVRQADKPAPTEVQYLSGSEKFRVSVAVALAIGRYATGKTRPLESVIIDEGFGSLDRDGLEAARTELKRLSAFLRRIILVSHQEDFANEFPVIIQLKRGPEGTTATTVRR